MISQTSKTRQKQIDQEKNDTTKQNEYVQVVYIHIMFSFYTVVSGINVETACLSEDPTGSASSNIKVGLLAQKEGSAENLKKRSSSTITKERSANANKK